MAVFSMVFITASLALQSWVFMGAVTECEAEDTQLSGYFHIIEGFSLFHHILSTYYTESSHVCGSLCLKNKQCSSFNFGRRANGKFVCELSSSNASQFPMDLKERSGFDYFTFLNSREDKSLCDKRSPADSPSVRCPLEIAVLPYIDDCCNVDTTLIVLGKSSKNITHVSFNPEYSFNFSESVRVCEILNGALATLVQMQAAWDNGFQQCNYGWIAEGVTVVPNQEVPSGCESIGLNPSSPDIDKGLKYDAYCFGVEAP